VYGASASTQRVEGGSDNGAFAVAGLPGIGAQQDPIEYNSTTWHTNLDTYERIVPEDVMHNAVLSASLMWHLANRPELLPRFAPNEMPAVPPARGGRGATNAAPTALGHVFVGTKGAPLMARAGTLTQGVAAAADTVTAAVVTQPAHGKVAVNMNGGFTYTPAAGFSGTDAFTYRATINGKPTDPAKVTVIVR
jgi:hypothetical protein